MKIDPSEDTKLTVGCIINYNTCIDSPVKIYNTSKQNFFESYDFQNKQRKHRINIFSEIFYKLLDEEWNKKILSS